MTTAEIIYQRVKTLPEQDIEKILTFIDKLTKTAIKDQPLTDLSLTLSEQQELQTMQAIAHQCATLPDLSQDNSDTILGYGINGVCE